MAALSGHVLVGCIVCVKAAFCPAHLHPSCFWLFSSLYERAYYYYLGTMCARMKFILATYTVMIPVVNAVHVWRSS